MSREQFDERYRLEPQRAPDAGRRERSRRNAERQREIQSRIPKRPANIAYFENLLSEPPGSGPRVGYFCNLFPPEIALALGARAVRLDCGDAALAQAGEDVLVGEVCPLAKASFARFLDADSAASRCDALVVPAGCDAKRKLGELLSDYLPTFTLNLPHEQDSGRYGRMAGEEFRRLADFLSERLGCKLRRGALRKAIEAGRRRTALARRLQALRGEKPGALSIRDFFVVIQASFTGVEIGEWLAEAERVLSEVEASAAEPGRNRPRLVLTGAPLVWPNFKLLNLIEECGADVVADTLCTGAQSVFDPVSGDEWSLSGMFRALSLRSIFGAACPCFISQGTRLARVLDLAAEFKADGVLGAGLRLCPLFDLETYRLARVLKARGIPYANLRTDYSLEDVEQLRVRVEAFLETLA